MNPEVKSALTTGLAVMLGIVASWLVKSGVITADQTSSFVEGGIGVAFALGTFAVVWWKSRQHTPANQIAAIENMPQATANAAVESLPTTAKNAIKIAAMTDEKIVAAAAALPDVTRILVRPDAIDGVGKAAADPNQPKVVIQGVKT